MFKHLIKNLKDDLETFSGDDCRQVKELISYLEREDDIPLKIIKKESYEFYTGYCKGKDVEPMTEWQFDLCKSELSW